MRDRLIELLSFVKCEKEYCGAKSYGMCAHLDKLDRCQIETIADYLLENGVIVPPVKVGDTVYYVDAFMGVVEKCKVYGFQFVNEKLELLVDDGEDKFVVWSWFNSKEEAEKALEERKNK